MTHALCLDGIAPGAWVANVQQISPILEHTPTHQPLKGGVSMIGIPITRRNMRKDLLLPWYLVMREIVLAAMKLMYVL